MHPYLGRLQVEPEGVIAVGNAYALDSERYAGYADELDLIVSRHGRSWGTDETGTQFSERFLQGTEQINGLVRGVQGRVGYAATGLRESGRCYLQVEDDAVEFTRALNGLPAGSGQAAEARMFRIAERMAPATVAPIPFERVPEEVRAPTSPLMSFSVEFGLDEARLNGVPVGDGYRLLALKPFPDGTVTLDVNRFDVVAPVAPATAITTATGNPIDTDGLVLFVVNPAAGVDPTVPGYEPLPMTYEAGTGDRQPTVAT
ncbi:hypothetical protein Val02_72160 [Virgisporangium aliadipatigenens]|uniref:Uncharacterized protein n=1 Tax=Virgisporangium aliadipatigenens TaxID=741659 RepID=A0A8J3YV02_9ACTN|nr:hypothetical protein [Virgisporangium aliadipatigenens]GIJ50330.1 hypothetical protein Val02_72160 [Virgisporangium aliadipatigenens]